MTNAAKSFSDDEAAALIDEVAPTVDRLTAYRLVRGGEVLAVFENGLTWPVESFSERIARHEKTQWIADAERSAAAEAPGAPFGIIDPDYARVFTMARCVAWSYGYALALHGSFTRDLDLIAVPWTDTANDPKHLIARIAKVTGLSIQGEPTVKPHGRKAWSLLFTGFDDPRWIDVSVMPRLAFDPSAAIPEVDAETGRDGWWVPQP